MTETFDEIDGESGHSYSSSVKIEIDNSLRLYLKEIYKIPLWESDQQIEKFRELEAVKETKDEERIHSIKTEIIEHNMRLVLRLAKRFVLLGISGLSFGDMIQEGNIGLIKAVDGFKYRKGCRFSTYAALWIKQSIRRAVFDNSRTVRLPAHVLEDIFKLNRVIEELREKGITSVTEQELAQETKLSATRVKTAILHSSLLISESLDAIDGSDEDDYGLFSVVEDKTFKLPDVQAMENEFSDIIHELLSELPGKKGEVISRRFGIDTGKVETLEQIGKYFSITRERVRQIQDEGMQSLRHSAKKKKLEGFL